MLATAIDPWQLTAFIEMGEPPRAIPILKQSERDFPDDDNPPARLAVAYQAMKDRDHALAASDRALQHVYGPRTLVVYRRKVDIR
jgi:hypothetical protein